MNIFKFNLRTWASNSESLRDLAKQHNVADVKEIVKVLGLCWNVKLSLCSKPEVPTSNEVRNPSLHIINLVTPVTVVAKLLLHSSFGKTVYHGIQS